MLHWNTPDPDWRPRPAPTRDSIRFHRTMPGYAPTPLVELGALARRLGVGGVLLKNESLRLGLPAFKVLGASWAVCREMSRRQGREIADFAGLRDAVRGMRLCLVTATDGNHGRGVARVARLLGLPCRVYVPADTVAARREGIASEGAALTVVEGTYDGAVACARDSCSTGDLLVQDTAWDGYASIPAMIVEGYATMFHEIDDELAARGAEGPDLVLVQIGVGSLAEAAARHYRREGLARRPALVGVEPHDAACALEAVRAGKPVTLAGPHRSIMAGMNCGTVSAASLPVLRDAFDAFLTLGDDRAVEGMRLLASSGVTAGETGAAGAGGLLELFAGEAFDETRLRLRLSGATRVLLINTEGATDPASYAAVVGPPGIPFVMPPPPSDITENP